MWNPSKGLMNSGGGVWRLWGLKDAKSLMITLHSPGSPTGETSAASQNGG
jgi:hypothetical protein